MLAASAVITRRLGEFSCLSPIAAETTACEIQPREQIAGRTLCTAVMERAPRDERSRGFELLNTFRARKKKSPAAMAEASLPLRLLTLLPRSTSRVGLPFRPVLS